MRRLVLPAWVLVATQVSAAAPFDGRWAADIADCSNENTVSSPVVVAPTVLSWVGAACVVRTSYLVKDTWHISARCWGEGAISDVPIRLQTRGERLVLNWSKARAEELRRCP